MRGELTPPTPWVILEICDKYIFLISPPSISRYTIELSTPAKDSVRVSKLI
jgi:hypothetical protein